MLRFDRKQQNSIKQLSFNKKKIIKTQNCQAEDAVILQVGFLGLSSEVKRHLVVGQIKKKKIVFYNL